MSAPNSSFDPVEVTPLHPDEVQKAVDEALSEIAASTTLDELKAVRLAHAGDRSALALANREIGALPPQARAEAGQRIGAARGQVKAALDERGEVLNRERDARVLIEERVDVTAPWDIRPRGARHPLTTLQERIADLFIGMGYEVAEGPEVEAEWFNFDALNIPPDHPARGMSDTFFVTSPESGVVLRTHTSPVQARVMLERKPPIYVIVPGRTYRTDELDATHTPVFHQVEGLVVDEGITMAHLKGTLEHFVQELFGADLRTRLRPSYFPFTEPSAEFYMKIRLRPDEPPKWVELGGCGMVDPAVFELVGYDPEEWSGFAFGFGIERIAMGKYGIPDIRMLFENDVRFLNQL